VGTLALDVVDSSTTGGPTERGMVVTVYLFRVVVVCIKSDQYSFTGRVGRVNAGSSSSAIAFDVSVAYFQLWTPTWCDNSLFTSSNFAASRAVPQVNTTSSRPDVGALYFVFEVVAALDAGDLFCRPFIFPFFAIV
jgi:hypothetical protein